MKVPAKQLAEAMVSFLTEEVRTACEVRTYLCVSAVGVQKLTECNLLLV
jgi:hypothetical protein